MRKLKKFLVTSFSLIIVTFLSTSIQAKVIPQSIEDLITQSELIVVGKVSSVESIEGVRFAKVEILQTLKGTSYENIYYSIERLIACDISAAVEGETALFFFDKYKIKTTLTNENQKPTPFQKTISFKETVEKLIDGSDLFKLSFQGRGRMLIQETTDKKNLKISDEVILPKGLKPELTEIINYTNKVLSSD